MKYYAVRKGRNTGIFTTWNACSNAVKGFSGAEYKSFTDIKEAEVYLQKESSSLVDFNFTDEQKEEMINSKTTINAFVDGSYDDEQKKYAFGLVALGLGETYEDSCVDFEPMALPMRNVAGELLGAITAMEYCLENNVKNLNLYFDYEGIEKWAIGDWKCNKIKTKEYKEFYDSIKDRLNVKFFKVPAHTEVEYNERVDTLAKQALGLV